MHLHYFYIQRKLQVGEIHISQIVESTIRVILQYFRCFNIRVQNKIVVICTTCFSISTYHTTNKAQSKLSYNFYLFVSIYTAGFHKSSKLRRIEKRKVSTTYLFRYDQKLRIVFIGNENRLLLV